METRSHAPNFTVSLRGYDREEVDEYLDSLSDALGHVDDAEEHNRRLQSHVARLNSRIKELEDRLRSDPPKTGVALGERIGILLREAEEAATETISDAESRAAALIADAEAKVSTAEETVRVAVARGEEQARRIETAARGEAEEIVAEAEARANLRTRQIEQWAEQVVSHTRAEEVRMLKEQQEKRKAAASELESLAKQRRAAVGTLHELRNAISAALRIVETKAATADADPTGATEAPVEDRLTPAPDPQDASGVSSRNRWDSAARPAEGSANANAVPDLAPAAQDHDDEGPITDEIELRDHMVGTSGDATVLSPVATPDAEGDDSGTIRIESWVSEGPKHFGTR